MLTPNNPDPEELRLRPHRPTDPVSLADTFAPYKTPAARPPRRRLLWLLIALPVLVLLAIPAFFATRAFLQRATRANLPQLDGTAKLPGLSAPVTIQRDAHGVPHIHAQTLDDLVLAQAWVTAHDRLWQMDLLRRHASGTLAAVLGPALLDHDRLQRTLMLRFAADGALATMPEAQFHLLKVYADGVNAAIADQESTPSSLPVEFRALRYKPEPWSPRDSLLVALVLFQDLTNSYQVKLDRERLTTQLPPELAADLYPGGSWRDHPPTQPPVDLTIPGPAIEDIPLDESQEGPFAGLRLPNIPNSGQILASIQSDVQPFLTPRCPDCIPGSNNWVVSGARTTSGKPLLSNDMHLAHNIPGIWYEADLEATKSESPMPNAEPFHAAGVTLPGLPFVVVGHNAHIAWGFTNLGADVQDLYLEDIRDDQWFQASDGSWQPLLHINEDIEVHGHRTEHLVIAATRHGAALTPVITPTIKGETRPISLRWTLYDPSVIELPFFDINTAHDWATFTAAVAPFGGPAQNVVYADDQGHIGYHAIGRIPLRGAAPTVSADLPSTITSPILNPDTQTSAPIANAPSPLTHTEIAARPATTVMQSGPIPSIPMPPGPAREWSGYIPFEQLPQVFDPPGGLLATANSRVTPDDYPYPITLDWAAPYRAERIWKLLQGRHALKPADLLAIQSDIYSDFDHVLAQRIAYAVDHSAAVASSKSRPNQAALRQAADLLRNWNGHVDANSAAANIVSAAHAAIWPLLLTPHLKKGTPATLYNWAERDYALEQLLMHTPARWLPPGVASWDDLLATALDKGLADAHAPNNAKDLAAWNYGRTHVVDIEHPVFGQSAPLARLFGIPTGTGARPQGGDSTTVKQVAKTFGPSERFTADLSNLDQSTLNIVLGESGNPVSPYYMDQFSAWLHGTSFPLPFRDQAVSAAATHTLTLHP